MNLLGLRNKLKIKEVAGQRAKGEGWKGVRSGMETVFGLVCEAEVRIWSLMANGKSLKDFRQERDMDSVCLFVLLCFNCDGSCVGNRLEWARKKRNGEDAVPSERRCHPRTMTVVEMNLWYVLRTEFPRTYSWIELDQKKRIGVTFSFLAWENARIIFYWGGGD